MDLEDSRLGKSQSVLVIDDEVGICQAIRRILEREGFQVEVAHDGQAGLDQVKRRRPDLALVDVKIPGIGGLDLITLIHQVDPEIICIVITGYATVEMAVTAIKGGAYDFLTKPFSSDTLLLAVNQGLERRMLLKEARRVAQAEEQARRLAQEKDRLEELNQAKAQFIRLVTHELQAPVAAVENYLQLILQGYVPPEREREILHKCVARTAQERMLIADLLELGKLEVLQPSPNSEASLSDALARALEDCRERAEQKGLEIVVDVDEAIPLLRGSPDQFKSLWSNLIGNAVKYTPEKGKIKIALRREEGNIIGSVSDTGIGIPEEDQPGLFSEFFRAANAKKEGLPGTGLGLAIVKKILESLGGQITVQSRPMEGATFRFSIPV